MLWTCYLFSKKYFAAISVNEVVGEGFFDGLFV